MGSLVWLGIEFWVVNHFLLDFRDFSSDLVIPFMVTIKESDSLLVPRPVTDLHFFFGSESYAHYVHSVVKHHDDGLGMSHFFFFFELYLVGLFCIILFLSLSFLIIIFWLHCMACWILTPQPGIEPALPVLEVQNLNHWTTREVCGGPFKSGTETFGSGTFL